MPEENITPESIAAKAIEAQIEEWTSQNCGQDWIAKIIQEQFAAERAANARLLEEIEQLKHQRNRAALEERQKYLPQLEKLREALLRYVRLEEIMGSHAGIHNDCACCHDYRFAKEALSRAGEK